MKKYLSILCVITFLCSSVSCTQNDDSSSETCSVIETTAESTTEKVSTEPKTEPTTECQTEKSTEVITEETTKITAELTTETQTEEIITTQAEINSYVLNNNTMKFHTQNCPSSKDISEENRESYEGTKDELISKGYDPCKRCNPR